MKRLVLQGLGAALVACAAACEVADEPLSVPRASAESAVDAGAGIAPPSGGVDEAGLADVGTYDGGYPDASAAATSTKTYTLTDDTALDSASHLMWQRGEPGQYFEAVPKDYCAGLSLGGFDGWRVPTLAELRTLLVTQGQCPLLDHVAFPTALCDWYMSSDLVATNIYDAQMLDFATGTSKSRGEIGGYFAYSARCVRTSP